MKTSIFAEGFPSLKNFKMNKMNEMKYNGVCKMLFIWLSMHCIEEKLHTAPRYSCNCTNQSHIQCVEEAMLKMKGIFFSKSPKHKMQRISRKLRDLRSGITKMYLLGPFSLSLLLLLYRHHFIINFITETVLKVMLLIA